MIKHCKLNTYMPLLLVSFILVAWTLELTSCERRSIPSTKASEIFKKNVMNPIPASVTNIQVDQRALIGGPAYVFRFDINRADLMLLVESKSLNKVWDVEYKNGRLRVGWDNSGPGGLSASRTYLPVYGSEGGLSEPAWFNLQDWVKPEAYGIEQKLSGWLNTQVLLYNEKEGEAYHITSRVK